MRSEASVGITAAATAIVARGAAADAQVPGYRV